MCGLTIRLFNIPSLTISYTGQACERLNYAPTPLNNSHSYSVRNAIDSKNLNVGFCMAYEFKEKEFLLILLENYEGKNGKSISRLSTHMFSNIPLSSNKIHNSFSLGPDQHAFYKREAEARGLIQIKPNGIQYHFTDEGYSKALQYKHPVKTFIKENWKFITATILTIIGLCFTLYKLALSVS